MYCCIGPTLGCQENPDPYLIFITFNNISRVNIDGNNSQTMVAGLNNGVAIDYDYYNDRMYWTDVSRGHIKTAPLNNGYLITTLVTGKMLLQHIPSPINIFNFQNGRICIQAANKMYAGLRPCN